MSPSSNFDNMNHPKINQYLAVPSMMEIISEGFISGEMDILQSKLKKLFALDVADFQTTKQ